MILSSLRSYLLMEWQSYKRLSIDGRHQLIAYLFAGMAAPMIGTFTSIFLWKQTTDVATLVMYNTVLYLFLPVGFYVNGILLKRTRPALLFGLGCLAQGFIPAILILLRQTDALSIVVLGAFFGVSSGIFWANRNILTLRATTSKDRLYFLGLESALGTATNIAIPILVGWLLVLGQELGLYSLNQAYRGMALIAFLLLAFAALWMRQSKTAFESIKTLIIQSPSPRWQRVRRLDVVNGFIDGLSTVLPLVLILIFVGQEATAGTIQTFSAVLATLALYVVGRRATRRHEVPILGVWVISMIVAGGVLAWFFRPEGVLAYFAIVAFTGAFRWMTLASIMYAAVEHEEKNHKGHHYAYLFDREIFLNIGRAGGLVLFYAFYRFYPISALRYMLLIGGVSQVLLYLQARHLATSKK